MRIELIKHIELPEVPKNQPVDKIVKHKIQNINKILNSNFIRLSYQNREGFYLYNFDSVNSLYCKYNNSLSVFMHTNLENIDFHLETMNGYAKKIFSKDIKQFVIYKRRSRRETGVIAIV